MNEKKTEYFSRSTKLENEYDISPRSTQRSHQEGYLDKMPEEQ